jgi:hypothetical protein
MCYANAGVAGQAAGASRWFTGDPIGVVTSLHSRDTITCASTMPRLSSSTDSNQDTAAPKCTRSSSMLHRSCIATHLSAQVRSEERRRTLHPEVLLRHDRAQKSPTGHRHDVVGFLDTYCAGNPDFPYVDLDKYFDGTEG